MVPEAHVVNDVPEVGGVNGPKGFARGLEESADSRVGVVDEDVQLAIFVIFNFFEKCFDFGVVGMVNYNRDANPAPGPDLVGKILEQLVGSA